MEVKLRVGFVMFILITMIFPLVFCQAESYEEPPTVLGLNQTDSFAPTVSKLAGVDLDNNRVADGLDLEIADRIVNGAVQDWVGVTITLKAAPTAQDVDAFVSSGGYLTTDLWTRATYGFGGRMKYSEIENFIERCSDVLLVEKEAIGKAEIAYAAQQVGARAYVWNTLGLQGDPNSSTALVDTGIDGSHVDFSPGYGDQNFSKKIVGWNDQVGFAAAPVDDVGHGSHCAGLAAGNGFFSVDAAGNALASWGFNSYNSGSALWFAGGMMVNKTGNISISVKWAGTGTAKLASFPLYYGDKTLSTGSWTQVASVSTPSQNTWYTLTYNVRTSPSGGYDMYHPLANATGTGYLFVTYNMSWPYAPPADGFSAWTGIAPGSKLVGVRVANSTYGTDNDFVDGINWIIANKITYHISVVSISMGFVDEFGNPVEISAVDSAMLNLVNSGVTTVVAAGNDGPGSNYVYSPASVDEVITVAAMNQFDNIASYSSQGGTSRYTGKTVKPDITAPGGSFFATPLFSVDSNYNDAEGGFTDTVTNDSAPMQGTSMAAPVIAGCAQIVVQAMGGYAKWNWTRSQALQPKMILLMTASETYPNLRETYSSLYPMYSPTLDRGGKDRHEGFGRVNLDAATDALLKTYEIGSVVLDSLGRPPTTADISVAGQRLAWARNVQLVSGFRYNFSLSVPAGADYDLYLYNNTGTAYGEPAVVARSTNETTGGVEQFWAAPLYNGTYYIVVKRATETTGNGNFTLSSSSERALPVNVTLTTFGLADASNVVHYVQNGVSKNGSIVGGVFSDYVDILTTLTIDNSIFTSTTQRYVATGPTAFTVQPNANPIQENAIVESPHPYPNSYNNNWTISRPNATRIRVHFSYIYTELNYDYVIVRRNATTQTSYTGFFSPVWSGWCDGNSTNIKLTSDGSVAYDGFFIDCLEYDLAPETQNNWTVIYQSENIALYNVTAWHWINNTVVNSVAAGDVDADGQVEIVSGGTYFDGTRNIAQLVIWNSSSLAVERLTTWYWTGNTTINSVAVGDVDDDGQAEIVTGGTFYDGERDVAQLVVWAGSDLAVKRLRAWFWGSNTVINSVDIGDVNADGHTEIVTAGYYFDGTRNVAQLVVWDGATLAPPILLTSWYWTDDTVINSVAIGDVDGDAQTEIVTGGYHFDGTRNVAQLVVWTGSGLAVDRLTSWYWVSNTVIKSVAVGDADADGQTEIVTGGYYNDGTRDIAQLVVWAGSNLTVDRLTSWYWISNTVINSVTLGDVEGDGQVEIVTGGCYDDGTRNIAQMVVWGGSNLAVENIQTWYWGGDTVVNSLCTSDINGDFTAELVTGGAFHNGLRWNAQLAVWGMSPA